MTRWILPLIKQKRIVCAMARGNPLLIKQKRILCAVARGNLLLIKQKRILCAMAGGNPLLIKQNFTFYIVKYYSTIGAIVK